jgi:hypothetical protein
MKKRAPLLVPVNDGPTEHPGLLPDPETVQRAFSDDRTSVSVSTASGAKHRQWRLPRSHRQPARRSSRSSSLRSSIRVQQLCGGQARAGGPPLPLPRPPGEAGVTPQAPEDTIR